MSAASIADVTEDALAAVAAADVIPLQSAQPESGDEGEPTLLRDLDDGGFALMVSMNHTVGDGHTYYSLYNMLGAGRDVRALEPRRVQGFEDDKTRVIGSAETAFQSSVGLGLGIVGTYLLAKITRRPRQHVAVRAVDQQWVSAKKEEAKDGDVAFVSTNDVVTSWFFGEMSSDMNLMVANFRSRTPSIADLDELHAGNYEANIPYFPGDVERPSLIRRSIQGADGNFRAKRAGTPATSVPGFSTRLHNRFSIITNWAGFYRDLVLDTADGERDTVLEPDLHLPVMETEGMMMSIWNSAVLFASSRGSLGLLLVTGDPQDAAPGNSQGPLGSAII